MSWHEIYVSARRAGLSRDEVWGSTPRELIDEFDVAVQRQRDDHNRDMVHAHCALEMNIYAMNKKRIPDLERFLAQAPQSESPSGQQNLGRSIRLWAEAHNARLKAEQVTKQER